SSTSSPSNWPTPRCGRAWPRKPLRTRRRGVSFFTAASGKAEPAFRVGGRQRGRRLGRAEPGRARMTWRGCKTCRTSVKRFKRTPPEIGASHPRFGGKDHDFLEPLFSLAWLPDGRRFVAARSRGVWLLKASENAIVGQAGFLEDYLGAGWRYNGQTARRHACHPRANRGQS